MLGGTEGVRQASGRSGVGEGRAVALTHANNLPDTELLDKADSAGALPRTLRNYPPTTRGCKLKTPKGSRRRQLTTTDG